MNTEHWQTVLEALTEWQTSLSENSSIYIVDDVDAKLSAIDAAIAAVEAWREAGEWQPVEDGTYRAANPKDSVTVEGPWLTVREVLFEGKSETADTLIALPGNIRLCRQVEVKDANAEYMAGYADGQYCFGGEDSERYKRVRQQKLLMLRGEVETND